ncbi:MFS transporter [Roseococcus sp. SYP-B2431]|uniref:MFS transporter n=1 Tax=Roseococcus sp. SYP-B2431 TaxID=2496640 RepID=UPI0013F3D624|nr:MFS transporter [Roseococcus sp. SYP-B2431]
MAGPGLLRLAPVALGTLIVPLDSAVNVAFPAMVAAFGLTVPDIQWIVICYVLTYGSLMLVVGRLGDIFGDARVFRFGLAWSAVSYLLLTVIPGYEALLVCRILQGIGAALVLGCGPALATVLFPETMRARALAAYAAMVAAGSTLGPLAGGMLVEAFGWQAVYWFRAPFALAGLLLSVHLPEASRSGPREPFDAPGAVLLVAAVATILLVVNRAPAPVSLVLAAAAIACAAGFVWRSQRAPRPIIDLSLFRRPGFVALNVSNVVLTFAGFAVMLLVPFYLARITGLEPAALGLVLATSPAGGMLGSWLGGRAVTRLGSRTVLVVGTMLNAAGLLGIATWSAGTAVPLLIAALAVQGIGLGLFTLAYTDRVTATMRREDRGVAGSLTVLTRTFGVVGAASLLTLLLGASEAALLAQGRPPTEASLTAFGRAFMLAGVLPLLALPLLLRQRG